MSGASDSGPVDATYKAIIIGDTGVGKTALLMRLTDNVFRESYVSTIGVDVKNNIFKVSDKLVKLQMWDTAGQERFRTITQSYYRGADGIIIVFDVTDKDSFDSTSHWMHEIDKANFDCVKFLIGNKTDLQEKRQVSFEEAQKFSKNHSFDYFETSAKVSGLNVRQAFSKVAEKLLKTRDQRQASGHIGDIDISREDAGGTGGTHEEAGKCQC
jgi:Ras-related protein Rab-1A